MAKKAKMEASQNLFLVKLCYDLLFRETANCLKLKQMTYTYLLLVEFEVRTVSWGSSFFLVDLWPARIALRPSINTKTTRSVTYITNRDNEVSKVLRLIMRAGKETSWHFHSIQRAAPGCTVEYGRQNWSITAGALTERYNEKQHGNNTIEFNLKDTGIWHFLCPKASDRLHCALVSFPFHFPLQHVLVFEASNVKEDCKFLLFEKSSW